MTWHAMLKSIACKCGVKILPQNVWENSIQISPGGGGGGGVCFGNLYRSRVHSPLHCSLEYIRRFVSTSVSVVMPVLPGYKYLGPGNSINSGDPVNETDLIAQIHDLNYTTAKDDNDIRKADFEAIGEFNESFKRDYNIGGLLGEIGIAGKYGVESVTGVLYGGGMKRTHSFGNELYKQRQAAIYKEFKRLAVAGEFNDLRAFRESQQYQDLLQSFRKGGENYKKAKTEFDVSDPRGGSDNAEPGPSNAVESVGEDEHVDNIDPEFDWGNFLVEFDAALPNPNAAALPSAMDTSQSGTDRGPNTGARSADAGPNVAAGTGATGATTAWIPKSVPSKSASVNFTKSRILYSYAYATENIQKKLTDHFTTCLALIPVDFLPFYLSPSEFFSLPNGSKVSKVWCTVKPLGTRTAFDTGTTLSGSATSEYIPIGVTMTGANNAFYGQNVTYGTVATAPMVPTSTGDISPDALVAKYYNNTTSNAMLIPRSISEYYVHEWNRSANPGAADNPDYIVHNAGVARMDEKVDRFMINQVIGQPVCEYIYVPRDGMIKQQKDHFVPYTRRKFAVESHANRALSSKLKFFESVTHEPAAGYVGLGDIEKPTVLTNQKDPRYVRQIENYGVYDLAHGASSYRAQPQLHVGMLATPQLNPSNEDKNFLNSCCYWQIECGISVTLDLSSAFTKSHPISWPREVRFYQNQTPAYTDGQTLFGMTDAGPGNVTSVEEALALEDEELGLAPSTSKRPRRDIFSTLDLNRL